MKNSILSISLFAGILLLLNVLSNRFFLRLDLTKGGQYTLSKATKDILRNLDNPVTVTAYFSDNLPPDIAKTRRDFQEMLVEYANISKGKLKFEFVNPQDDAKKQEVANLGIQPVMINVREKDQVKQQQAFLGAMVRMGDRQEPIPVIQPGMAMEYSLSTSIKKMSVVEKPLIGFVQGHGEAAPNDMPQAIQELQILYSVMPVNIVADSALSRYRALAIVAPRDSFAPAELSKLDAYLAQGGKMVLALNAVDGNLQTAQGTPLQTGLESWLSSKGVIIQPQFIIDAQCGSVTVQQQQGFFVMNTPVQFPFLPIISNFADHPVTKGLEQVMMTFASPLSPAGNVRFSSLAATSARSGLVGAPTTFNIQTQWTQTDFTMSALSVACVLEGNDQAPFKMVIFGDGDFAVNAQGRAAKDNVSLLVNSIDWLSDDTGLIELRTKGVAGRPIDASYLGDDSRGTRNTLKAINIGLPILLALLYAVLRAQRQRSIRMKRMEEDI